MKEEVSKDLDEGEFPTEKILKFDNMKFSHHILERKKSLEFNENFNLHFSEALEARNNLFFLFFFEFFEFFFEDYPTNFERFSDQVKGVVFISKHYVSFSSSDSKLVKFFCF